MYRQHARSRERVARLDLYRALSPPPKLSVKQPLLTERQWRESLRIDSWKADLRISNQNLLIFKPKIALEEPAPPGMNKDSLKQTRYYIPKYQNPMASSIPLPLLVQTSQDPEPQPQPSQVSSQSSQIAVRPVSQVASQRPIKQQRERQDWQSVSRVSGAPQSHYQYRPVSTPLYDQFPNKKPDAKPALVQTNLNARVQAQQPKSPNNKVFEGTLSARRDDRQLKAFRQNRQRQNRQKQVLKNQNRDSLEYKDYRQIRDERQMAKLPANAQSRLIKNYDTRQTETKNYNYQRPAHLNRKEQAKSLEPSRLGSKERASPAYKYQIGTPNDSAGSQARKRGSGTFKLQAQSKPAAAPTIAKVQEQRSRLRMMVDRLAGQAQQLGAGNTRKDTRGHRVLKDGKQMQSTGRFGQNQAGRKYVRKLM